jgi:two-component system, sensor histidine kinase
MGNKKRPDYFIDIMGHDINNLNQVILSYLELLQASNRLDDEQNRYLANAIVATRDCANIVKSVKAVQKISAENPAALDLDLDELICECVKEVPRPAEKKVTIRFTSSRQREGRIVRALPELKLAFCNVIGNSIKYSGREVNIEISTGETRENGRRCFVTAIADDGNGIPDSVMRTLFSTPLREAAIPPGKGLGLYIAKALAEAFGGRLKVEDRVRGDYRKGTKVTITLPAREES